MTLTLNCDLGEGQPEVDAALMPYVDMANIACGGHASDAQGMLTAVKLAKAHQVKIGAHPSYEDKANFGRVDQDLSSENIETLIVKQVHALMAICLAASAQVAYIKPHGALYNRMTRDKAALKAILNAAKTLDLPLMVLAKADMTNEEGLASSYGVQLIKEVFCDRGYLENGELVPRDQTGALLNEQEITQRINDLLTHSQLKTSRGTALTINADTMCVHGDDPHAIESVKSIRTQINQRRFL